jgi:hypothetical protein
MRRTDILPEHIPFVDKVDEADAFLYYSRFHFMEGITGEDGHTEVIVFLQSQPHACWRFGGIDYWKNRRDVQTVRQQVLFDEPFPCRVFIRMLQKLVRNGILDIPSQEKSWSLGHLHETVGIRIKNNRENWYIFTGGTHHDKRHEEHVASILLRGKYGLITHLRRLQ